MESNGGTNSYIVQLQKNWVQKYLPIELCMLWSLRYNTLHEQTFFFTFQILCIIHRKNLCIIHRKIYVRCILLKLDFWFSQLFSTIADSHQLHSLIYFSFGPFDEDSQSLQRLGWYFYRLKKIPKDRLTFLLVHARRRREKFEFPNTKCVGINDFYEFFFEDWLLHIRMLIYACFHLKQNMRI